MYDFADKLRLLGEFSVSSKLMVEQLDYGYFQIRVHYI